MLIESIPSSVSLALAAAVGIHSLAPCWQHLTQLQLASRGTRLKSLGFKEEAFQLGLFIWAAVLVLVVATLAIPLGMWPIAVVIGLLMAQAPVWLISEIIRRRENVIRNQLGPACFSLACGIRAGLALPEALERTASESPKPIHHELTEIVHHYRRGVPLRAAIEQVRHRLGLEMFSLVAMALYVTMERGGNVNQALDRIGQAVRETQRLEGRLEALTASSRKGIVTLAIFPIVFLSGFAVVDTQAVLALFTTFAGQLAFCVAAAVTYVSFLWATRILRSVV